jgi:arylsulfatase A-like enzyme
MNSFFSSAVSSSHTFRLAGGPLGHGLSLASGGITPRRFYTFDADPNGPTWHTTQYFEMAGERVIYHDGWIANTMVVLAPWQNNPGVKLENPLDYKWELYDLSKDWTQYEDVAAKYPDTLKEMQAVFVKEAKKYNVFPLDNEGFQRVLQPRPSASPGMTEFT